jgi:hypothetical protein
MARISLPTTLPNGYTPTIDEWNTTYFNAINTGINPLYDDTEAISANVNQVTIVGEIKDFHKNITGASTLGAAWIECNGTLITATDSPMFGLRAPNLNGASLSFNYTWVADAGGSYATSTSSDIWALNIGDTVSGAGVSASAQISDIDVATRIITITQVDLAGAVTTTITNDGVFLAGGSDSRESSSDKMQGHWHSLHYTSPIQGYYAGVNNGVYPSTTTPNASTSDKVRAPLSDGVNGTPRTGSRTVPQHRKVIKIMRIK